MSAPPKAWANLFDNTNQFFKRFTWFITFNLPLASYLLRFCYYTLLFVLFQEGRVSTTNVSFHCYAHRVYASGCLKNRCSVCRFSYYEEYIRTTWGSPRLWRGKFSPWENLSRRRELNSRPTPSLTPPFPPCCGIIEGLDCIFSEMFGALVSRSGALCATVLSATGGY